MSTIAPVRDVEFVTEMKDRFVQFGTYANLTRGVPSVLDGLKPVQRRILWAMYADAKALPDRKKPKSAKVIGFAMSYHPHGNEETYKTMARLAHVPSEGEPFRRNVPLIEGQGSWGDLSDPQAAAMRYTECCLSPASLLMLGDASEIIGGAPEIRENGVDLVPNYSGETVEPSVLPALIPAYVVNGASGIGVGLSMDTPGHNLRETLDLALRLVDTPNPRLSTILETLPGPDFPCDADIFDVKGGIASYLTTGTGKFILRARWSREEYKITGRRKGVKLVITGLPYAVSPESVVAGIGKMIAAGLLPSEVTVTNYSSISGHRIVVDAGENDPGDIERRLLFHGTKSRLQLPFTVHSRALVNERIESVSTVDALRLWVDHRRDVMRRRSRYRLDKAKTRLEIVEGFIRAIPVAEKIVTEIRAADSRAAAVVALTGPRWKFSEPQAGAILDLTLSALVRLGLERYVEEKAKLVAIVDECEELLAKPAVLDTRLKKEIRAVRSALGRDRRCAIMPGSAEVEKPETPAVEVPAVKGHFVRTGKNFIRFMTRASSVGVVGNDHVVERSALTDQVHIDFVSNLGNHFRKLAGELPDKPTKAEALFNDLLPGERFVYVGSGELVGADSTLVVLTSRGLVKRLASSDWSSHVGKRALRGRPVIPLADGDEVVSAFHLPAKNHDLVMVTAAGRILRVAPTNVNTKGRAAAGMPLVKLSASDDRIVFADALTADSTLVYFTTDEKVGWFGLGEFGRVNRNVLGNSCTRSNSRIAGVRAGVAPTMLAYFDGTTDSARTVELTGQTTGGALSDRQLKIVAPGITKANAVFFPPSA